MGFSIGRFLGGIAPELGQAAGTVFGGQLGGAIGRLAGEVAGEQLAPDPVVRAAAVGRQTIAGPVSTSLGRASLQFGGGGFFPTSAVPTALGGSILRGLGRGGGALQLFGNGNGNGGSPISRILAKARAATGGPVTRNKIIDAAKACGLEVAADTFGLDLRDICMVVVKGRTRRRRGVSAADVRRTKRTIRFASAIRKDLKVLAR